MNTEDKIKDYQAFRREWNKVLNANRKFLYHGPSMKLIKAVCWDLFEKTGKFDFKAAANIVMEGMDKGGK